MPSIRYYNQTAPFWDFVANLENEGVSHPWFGGQARDGTASESDETGFGRGPWSVWGPPGGFPFRGPPPHHGPHHRHQGPPPGEGHGHPPHHRGPPPPPGEGPSQPPPDDDAPPPPFEEQSGSAEYPGNEKGEASKSAGQDADDGPRRCGRGPRGWGRRGHCGGRRFGKGPWGGPWGGFPFGGFGGLAGHAWGGGQQEDDGTFRPEADVFDTESAYVVHLSLPGGKKEDINVSWNSEKSELAVTGVLHRPGDEEFLKSLAMDERKIGMFERKIRLGSLANPAQVDVEGIGAKLENGILSITVPKLDKDYVEVKMVDIE